MTQDDEVGQSDQLKMQADHIPVIDLAGLDGGSKQRDKIIKAIREALEKWGALQVMNHGISLDVMEEMIQEVRKFNEGDEEVKARLSTTDISKKVRYTRSCKVPAWRNTLTFLMNPDPPTVEEFPSSSRDKMLEYVAHIQRFTETLFGIVSEGLGLRRNLLEDIGCLAGMRMACQYYPPNSDHELPIGTVDHCDPSFLTVLLQDQVGGLQIYHQNRWVNVPPKRGALVILTGDLLQLITNDKFKGTVHRALANCGRTRISVACLINAGQSEVIYGPLKELLADGDRPLYEETTARDYTAHLYSCVEFTSGLEALKLSSVK